MCLTIVKAGYRGWFAINNLDNFSNGTFSINGNLIQIVAMAIIIIVCPILIYVAETSKLARENDGTVKQIYAKDNLRKQLKPKGFIDSDV